MKGKNKFSIVFLALVVAVSGCADSDQDETSSTAPLQISDFSASPNPVTSDRTTQFNIELQNTGDSDAEEVAARIFGPTFATNDSGQETTWRSRNGNSMDQEEDRTVSFGSLRAPTNENPAIPKTRTISLTSPNYDEGTDVQDTFYMELFYQYETDAESELTLMTEQRRRETGTTKSQPSIDNNAGPIQMDIRGSVPKIQYGDEGDQTEEICITVSNEGQGTPFIADNTAPGDNWDVSGAYIGSDRIYSLVESSEGDTEKNTEKVELTLEDVGNINFSPKGDNENVREEGNSNSALVELVDGTGYQCFEWGIDGGDQLPQEEQTVNLQVTAEYGYTKETSTSVTVEGRR